jgi:pulcherriminic acid synthase
MPKLDDAPDIFSAEFQQDPYTAYARMVEDFPLLWHEGLQGWIITRFEDVCAVLKDATFSTAPYEQMAAAIHGRTIVNMDGREHAVHRSLVVPAFRGKVLQEKYVPAIRSNAKELVDRFKDEGRVELVDQFASRFPINTIVDMLGLPKSDHDRFHYWYTTIIAFFYNLAGDPAIIEQGMKMKADLADYMIPIINQRRESPGDDLLSTLCTAEVDGVRMTDEEIKAFCSLLVVAGGETTDKALSSMFRYLVANPGQLAAVREDRSLVLKAFAETLRMAPPVQVVPRQATRDAELSGGSIARGDNVYCMLAAANRDPRRWAEGHTFNIFRSDLDAGKVFTANGEITSFGLGRHFCVGSILARTEVEYATNLLLDVMQNIRFTDGVGPPEEGLFARGPKTVRLTFTPAA